MRHIYQGSWKDGNGSVISGGTVTAYLAGTTTLATIYDSFSGGSAISSSTVTSDSNGAWSFYVDEDDYSPEQLFKIVLSKVNYQSSTYDDLNLFKNSAAKNATYDNSTSGLSATNVQSGIDEVSGKIDFIGKYADLATAVSEIDSTKTTLLINDPTTIADGVTVVIPSTMTLWFTDGGMVQGTAGGTATLTINGGVEAGLVQIFGSDLVVTYGPLVLNCYPEWYIDNTIPGTTDMTLAVQAAFDSTPKAVFSSTYRTTAQVQVDLNNKVVEFIAGALIKPDTSVLVGVIIGGDVSVSRMSLSRIKVDRGTYDGVTENIGFLFLELNQCTFYELESRYSKYNFKFAPDSGGCAYSTFINPQAIGGFYNYWMEPTAVGWVNENDFIGGRGFCTSDTDTNFMLSSTGLGTGHNRISMSLEGQGVQGVYDNGSSNQFIQCRSEGTWSSGFFHVLGVDCQYSLIISSRIDYSIDTSIATDPREQIINYNVGSTFSTAKNGLTTLSLVNQSAAGGSGLDITSTLDVDTAFAWRAKRGSDSLVRASCSSNGEMFLARSLLIDQSGYNFEPLRLGTTRLWFDSSALYTNTGSAPVDATDGNRIPFVQSSVAAGLGNIANIVNTVDKYIGKMVYDTDLKRPVFADGSADSSIWVFADGTTAYTPS